ncbi:two component transcriptional regulator, winged helix family [Arcobacter nitrofigilis DSM 7299]|jgi:two-component system, OmpR family, copper resistance phosphate regulon response regulator CusR|uniref:Two component transcriptional regulator, winged helix family n=1 Tax=Arcobacter nitrofigilis (strain ATCC 33309 / DSM 7299 / CCUG 15893 / LMG 7604 / NCTC 12251 / CI) TaxID=572480 RepID=D5V805_ARCNC|nr:response regulator transcription factor [Arcobacter nitrofigilis]ADG94775.1 two component transcriptional regulator, winged helix family [Arcobacter nitrofigilis DSM 7299]
MKILIIEDDVKIVNFLKKGLEEESYSIDYSHNGEEGLYLASVNSYDLILLDIMLPLLDGIEVCKKLRAEKINTPIIMLTAKDSIEDTIKGLDIGANDYLPKPFSFSELLARIRVQLRAKDSTQTTLKIADLELDLLAKTAKRAGEDITLTAKEFSLLEYLIKNQNKVLSETVLASMLNNMDESNISNLVNVYIYRLRNKIDKPYEKKLIKTIRGLGFKIDAQ